MLRVIHSIPEECPDCGSDNMSGRMVLVREEGNTVVCNHCGIIMVLRDEWPEEELDEDRTRGRCEEDEATASFAICPHCSSVDAIYANGGEEWCGACGLDPSKEDYPPEAIAHLWNPGSTLQIALQRGRPKAGRLMYEFLTTLCGPHCSFAASCPQTAGNLNVCRKEERDEALSLRQLPLTGEVVVTNKKKGKRERRKEKRRRIKAEKALAAKSQLAVLECAASGWYERTIKHRNETENLQELTHTGSGSRT